MPIRDLDPDNDYHYDKTNQSNYDEDDVSRSNPNDQLKNPAQAFFEWNAKKGLVKVFYKATKERGECALPWKFLLLDQLTTIKGYNKRNQDGIWANEIRNTMNEALVVKWHKGGTIAEGKYQAIKEVVKAQGGKYTKSLYIAYAAGDTYALGNLSLKGSAFSAWMTFADQHPSDLYSKAIAIRSFTEDTSGDVTYRIPLFALVDVSQAAQEVALALDADLQRYLTSYLKRGHDEAPDDARADDVDDDAPAIITDDVIPF